nr:hypothetical protein Iba_scaffold2753CG0490 [Ipomoea batatas]
MLSFYQRTCFYPCSSHQKSQNSENDAPNHLVRDSREEPPVRADSLEVAAVAAVAVAMGALELLPAANHGMKLSLRTLGSPTSSKRPGPAPDRRSSAVSAP